MINSVPSVVRTLLAIPYHMVVRINSLRARIAEIARPIFSFFSNRRQDSRSLNVTGTSSAAITDESLAKVEKKLQEQSKEQTNFEEPIDAEESLRRSINLTGWGLMKAFLDNKQINTFQFSVPDCVIHFAKAARGASQEDQVKLGNALYMGHENWPNNVLQWGKDVAETHLAWMKHYEATVAKEGVDLRDKEEQEQALRFDDPTNGVELVNQWANKKTNGEIPRLIEDLDPETPIVFLTASIFQSQWKSSFNKAFTVPSDFTNSDGKTIELPMMTQTTKAYKYALQEDMDMRVLELSFKTAAFSLLIFLPFLYGEETIESEAKASLGAFQKYFNQTTPLEVLDDLNKKLRNEKLEIHLPKIVLESNTDFLADVPEYEPIKIVTEINVQHLATNIGEPLYVQKMFAKSKVEWNEKEMKATFANLMATGPESSFVNLFIVNRPHAWMLVSKKGEKLSTIFFMGVVGNLSPEPEKKG